MRLLCLWLLTVHYKWCKMAECFCCTRCLQLTGADTCPVSMLQLRPANGTRPSGVPALQLSSLFVPDSLQWCHSVGRSRGSMSACLRVPLLLRQGVFPPLLSCRRELKPLELHLCDIMAVLRRVCGSLHCGCCRIRDIKPPEDALNPAADESSLKDTYHAHFQVSNFILACSWNTITWFSAQKTHQFSVWGPVSVL